MDTTATLSPLGWLGFVLFVPALVWGLIGNIKLHHQLRLKGIRVPFLLAGMTLLVYTFYRPSGDPAETDRTAFTTLVAWLLLLATFYWLGPYMGSSTPPA